MRHAVESYNATPTASNPANISPRNVWHNRVVFDESGKPSILDPVDESFRRTFGAQAYVSAEKRSALGSRCEPCTFVGYAPDHADGVYDFLCLKTQRLWTSRNAVFDERNVTPKVCHQYITDEETRTLPDWMQQNPFQVSHPVTGSDGTGSEGYPHQAEKENDAHFPGIVTQTMLDRNCWTSTSVQ